MPPENEWPVAGTTGHQGGFEKADSIFSPNPSPIQRPTQEFVPTLTQCGVLQLDTPTKHGLAYQFDKTFLRSPKGRRHAIRSKHSEFEGGIFDGRPLTPTLWVLVTQIAVGFHMIMPLWRGDEFFQTKLLPRSILYYADVTTDAEIAEIICECDRRGGLNVDQWETFIQRLNDFHQNGARRY